MKSKTATFTLFLTGAITVGMVSLIVATNASNNRLANANGLGSSSTRELTVTYSNSVRNFQYGSQTVNYSAAFPMSDGLAYAAISTGQRQDMISEQNNAVLALWKDAGEAFFAINNFGSDTATVTINDQEYPCVKFKHLTSFDIKLDKGNGSDRVINSSELFSEVNNSINGVFTKIAETNEYVQYNWAPDSGYISNNQEVHIGTAYVANDQRAIWVTDIVFHYEC